MIVIISTINNDYNENYAVNYFVIHYFEKCRTYKYIILMIRLITIMKKVYLIKWFLKYDIINIFKHIVII